MVAAETILCHGADPTPADHAIQPRSRVGGHGIGGEYLGRLTMVRSRFDCRRRGGDHLALLDARLPLAHFLGSLPLVAAQFGDLRNHLGADPRHQPIGLLALVVARQHPAGAAGNIGNVRAPLVEDQIQVPAEGIWRGSVAHLRRRLPRRGSDSSRSRHPTAVARRRPRHWRLALAQFLGRLALMAAQVGDQRDDAGVDVSPADRLPSPCSRAPANRWRRRVRRPCRRLPPSCDNETKCTRPPCVPPA
jgi:hypothetical protein